MPRSSSGREALVDRLVDKVRHAPLTALVGRSGSGKSSVVQAGLLPALHATPGAVWHVVTLRPGADPLVALAGAFDPPPAEAGLTRQLEYLNDAAARLRDGRVGLRQLAGTVLETLPESARILVVVDQWEELYTQAGRGDDVARFVALILELAEAERVHGVLVLRADFYADAMGHPGLSPILERRPSDGRGDGARGPRTGHQRAGRGDGPAPRRRPPRPCPGRCGRRAG